MDTNNKLPSYSTLLYNGTGIYSNTNTHVINMHGKNYLCKKVDNKWKVVREYDDTFPIDAKELE